MLVDGRVRDIRSGRDASGTFQSALCHSFSAMPDWQPLLRDIPQGRNGDRPSPTRPVSTP
jgi:hypothetical protein